MAVPCYRHVVIGKSLRASVALACVAILIAACQDAAPSIEPEPTSIVDATGILIVDVAEQVQGGPVPRRFAEPFSDAMLLAEANPDDLGYPWLDPAAGELVLSAVTPRGRELIQAAGITVPYRVRDVDHGVGDLRRIQDDVTLLGSRGVEGAELIFMTLPDHRDNRALVVMSAMSRSLLDYLAASYPPDAIAVQVDPDLPAPGPIDSPP
jgi:hypothetical protein